MVDSKSNVSSLYMTVNARISSMAESMTPFADVHFCHSLVMSKDHSNFKYSCPSSSMNFETVS